MSSDLGLLYGLQILGTILGLIGSILCFSEKERLFRIGISFGLGGIMAMLTLIYVALFNIASLK